MTLPFVSVVIPVYNDAERLQKTLSALFQQTYPEYKYEIIVVDNGSTDNTSNIIDKFPIRSNEVKDIQSPYAARNCGIEMAKGDVIALLDATCIPINVWMESAIECLYEYNSDIVAGDIQFELGDNPSPAELYDSIAHVQVERNVRERGVATTGNLIVKKKLFNDNHLGKFPIVRSSADVEWTDNATTAGYTLRFCPNAVSTYPPKNFPDLMRKAYRVGKGKPKTWARKGKHPLEVAAYGILNFPSKIVQMIIDAKNPSQDDRSTREPMPKAVFAVGAFAFGVQLCGSIVSIIAHSLDIQYFK